MGRYSNDPYSNGKGGDNSISVWFIGGIAVVALFVGFIWAVLFVFTGWKSTPPDKMALHYTGGPIQGVHFKEIVGPGHKTSFVGLLENWYLLPATQRTYIITSEANRGDRKGVDVVTAASKADTINGQAVPSVPMNIEGSIYFKINTSCKNPNGNNKGDCVVRDFMNQICLHDNCTNLDPGGGWDTMLDTYLRPQIEQAIRTEVGKYNYADLWHSPDVRAAVQKAIAPVLASDINNAIGGDYFCGPDSTANSCTPFSFVLSAASPPQAVQDSFTHVAAAQQDAQAKVTAANGDAQAQAARASAPAVPPQATSYIKAQAMASCASNPNCKLIIVEGTGATVQVPGQ